MKLADCCVKPPRTGAFWSEATEVFGSPRGAWAWEATCGHGWRTWNFFGRQLLVLFGRSWMAGQSIWFDMKNDMIAGWWWLEHEFYIFPYIGNVIIPIGFHIFQKGRYTTNIHQPDMFDMFEMAQLGLIIFREWVVSAIFQPFKTEPCPQVVPIGRCNWVIDIWRYLKIGCPIFFPVLSTGWALFSLSEWYMTIQYL